MFLPYLSPQLELKVACTTIHPSSIFGSQQPCEASQAERKCLAQGHSASFLCQSEDLNLSLPSQSNSPHHHHALGQLGLPGILDALAVV